MDIVDEDETALVERARTDREAFGLLYDRYFDPIYNYIARRVSDESVAEDVTSEVWERALGAIERYELRGLPFAAWLYRIAGNRIANHHRRSRFRRTVPLAPQLSSGSEGRRRDDRLRVQAALQSLSLDDQEVVGLYYFAGMKPAEIAEVMGCSTAAVHKRLHRARSRLKKLLQGDLGVA